MNHVVNVLDYGAVGDGRTLNTEAIAAALEALHRNGGGELHFPAGTYLSGRIRLFSHLSIVLERGAVLKASENIADHFFDTSVPSGDLRHYFIYGMDLQDVSITGEGSIDGSGAAYWTREYFSGDTDDTLAPNLPVICYNVYKPLYERPIVLYLIGCEDVRISGITVRNAAIYTLWLIGCRRAMIDGVTIRNPRNGPNTDAIDINCSQQVRIVNCDVNAGDDCIAIQGDPGRLKHAQPCQDLLVSNCILSSSTCGIRVGVGDDVITNALFSDLVIYDTRHGIDIFSVVCGKPNEQPHGTKIENLRFDSIVMRNVGQAFFIWAGTESPETLYAGYVRNISFSGMTIESVATSYIATDHPGVISDLRFRDVVMHVADLPEFPADEHPEREIACFWGGHCKSGGLRMRGIAMPEFNHVRITCSQPGQPDVILEEKPGL